MVAYSFKERFIKPIQVGLSSVRLSFDPPPKRQTVRADRRRHARPGEELQLYYGMRTKHCRLIGRAHCVAADSILIVIHPTAPRLHILAGGRVLEPESFAQSDGFESMADMRQFWLKEHPGIERFQGVLIRWEPLK